MSSATIMPAPSAVAPWVLDFDVPGEVVPWARTNHFNGRQLTPAKQRGYMAAVKQIAALGMRSAPPQEGALGLLVVARFLRPKSASKRRPPYWKATRPDADNIGKIVKDALNGIVWRDDAQVSLLSVRKIYSETAGLAIHVVALEDE